MTEQENKFIAHWEKVRQMPKWKYMFIHGSVFWGIPVAIILFIAKVIFGDFSFAEATKADYLRELLTLPAYMLGGLFYAWYMRKRYEKKYQNLINE